jgi:CDP-glycerol glycerophosphotransferase (TagB/SpsB family)
MIRKIVSYVNNKVSLWMQLLRIFVFKILSFIYIPFLKKNKYWLFLERGNDAQDNAWHMFKYVINNHPEINALYAIHKDSKDYRSNLQGYESNVIEYDSFRYYMLLYNCQVMLSSHAHTYVQRVWGNIVGGCLDIKGKKVLLQHGIVHNHMTAFIYPRLHIDLMMCGAKNEYNLNRKIFGYPESCLCYAGLARFDNLHEYQTKKQVLIMPTWRSRYSRLTAGQFKETDFYREYKNILTNPSLIKSLEEKDYNLVFYNHYEFQKFNSLFRPFCTGRVQLKFFGEQSVQQLLKESCLLVTDFSSIYYDFLYMRKPIIFFLLNQEEFRANQYGKDYDNPNDFGDVVEESDYVVQQIIKNLNNNCEINARCLQFSKTIFPLYDQCNCMRIYNRVQELINK